jgi:hypothetical protein
MNPQSGSTGEHPEHAICYGRMRAQEPNVEQPFKRIRMHVHDSDDLRVDGILRLIEEGGKQGALSDVLSSMCREVAVIAHADVVSVYVLVDEGGERTMIASRLFFLHHLGRIENFNFQRLSFGCQMNDDPFGYIARVGRLSLP